MFALSPVDQVFIGEDSYSIEFAFFYGSKLDVKKLESSLKKALQKFWPLHKTLKLQNGIYGLDGDAEIGLEFENITQGRMPSFTDFEELCRLNLPIKSIADQALIRAKVFEYKEGSVLTLNISHSLVDGYSYFLFASDWALTAKSSFLDPKSLIKHRMIKPVHDRQLLIPELDEKAKEKTREKSEEINVEEKVGLHCGDKRSFGSMKEHPFEVIEIKKIKVEEERKEIQSRSEKRISENDVLAAILLKKLSHDWVESSDENKLASLNTAFDFRRVHSSINRFYFGNAVMIARASFSTRELNSLSVGEIAERTRQAVKGIDEAVATDALRELIYFREQNGIDAFDSLHVSDPENGFLMTNLSRMPSDILDFGTGAPYAAVPLTTAPRSIAVTGDENSYFARVTKK